MNQVIMGFDHVIDLDYKSLKFIMDLYEIEDQKRCFELIISMFREVQKLRINTEDTDNKSIEQLKNLKKNRDNKNAKSREHSR